MTLLDTLQSQLTDPFRIGLMVVMVLTAARTQAAMGVLIPLALGVVFVALMIPMTMQSAAAGSLVWLAGVGLLSNVIILAVVLAIKAAVQKARG